MVLADSSAWIEFLRGTGSPAHIQLRKLLAAGAGLSISGAILMEVLAGARDERSAQDLGRLLAGAEHLALQEPEDFEVAAAIFRAARAAGSPIRGQLDCLNAAIAIRHRIPILHQDRDYHRIAAVSPLELVELDPS